MTTEPGHRPHHHGNLRAAMIDAGLELLREGGLNALTVRGCAARAGVSHAAPAHHFKDRNGLVAAIMARGYQIFSDTMIEERDAAEDQPHSRLLAICRGYLRFSEEHFPLFDVMFSAPEQEQADPELQRQSARAYQILSDCCAPFQCGPASAAGAEAFVWSLVHGFASLSRKGGLRADPATGRKVEFEDIFPRLDLAQAADE